jgi:hypothetical protein
MNRIQFIGAAIAALAFTTSPADATFVAVSGPQSSLGALAAIISAPSAVLDATVTNLGQEGFNERHGVVLTANISTDQGTILAGTRVDSHMIFFNQPDAESGVNSHNGVMWTFDGTILGTMTDSPGLLEAASNSQLGSLTTTYPGAFSARGLEGADAISISGNQLMVDVDMTVAQPGDWMRVVTTTVPEPGTSLIIGLGLAMLGVGATRRRKARA